MAGNSPHNSGGLDAAGGSDSIPALESEVHGCHLCPLAATRHHAVPGEGDSHAVVMFVGEGPGFEEDRQGRPFVGKSGQFLTGMIERIGLRREAVYITNVVKCRPPDNRDPLPHELAACSDYLDRQVTLINPRIIVTLGRFSMRRWFADGSITKIHGQVRNIGRGRIALAMFHPAAALRNPVWRVEFEKDFMRLPGLIARAVAADAAADAGDGLPAGVPHPGDPDYLGPGESAGSRPSTPSAWQAASIENQDKPDSDFTQLSLF